MVSAMDTADAAGGEDTDACQRGADHGSGYGGGTVLTAHQQYGQIAAAGLGHRQALFAQVFDLFRRAADSDLSLDDGNGGGHSTVFTDDLFHVQRGLHILGIGHAVGDDGGFQGHNRFAGSQGFLHLRGDGKVFAQVIHDDTPFLLCPSAVSGRKECLM